MASRARSIPQSVRELCLAFPEVEEFESHGSPNFRARKGKVFAVFSLNHHGDGRVALWLATPAMEQSRLIASAPKAIFKPPYVGPSGWIGVDLDRGFSWKRLIGLVHMAYTASSPARLVAQVTKPPVIAAPTRRMKPAEIDRMKSPRALKALARMRRICLALPETSESLQFGSPIWRVGKRGFALLYDYGKGLTASVWVGIERQGPLEMDPRMSVPAYMGHNGWIAMALEKMPDRELSAFVIESYRHFASRRAVAELDRKSRVAS
jgi:predicted DNA-binding protein (MmcQ/YjbR family)